MNDSISSSEDPAGDAHSRFQHSLIVGFFIALIGFTVIGAVAGIDAAAAAVAEALDPIPQPPKGKEMPKDRKQEHEDRLKHRPAVASTSLERPIPDFGEDPSDHAGIPDEVANPNSDDVAEVSRALRISRLRGEDW